MNELPPLLKLESCQLKVHRPQPPQHGRSSPQQRGWRQTGTFNPQLSTFVLALAGFLLAGCIRFHPQPLSPEQTAATLETRSLTNAVLESFLQTNLHRQFIPWPPRIWDLDMLTLAGFYYNPALEIARADWRVASSGIETAKERPNPSVSASGIHEPVPDAPTPWIPSVLFDLPVETAGKRRFRTEEAQHLAESARLNLISTAWQVRSQIRAASRANEWRCFSARSLCDRTSRRDCTRSFKPEPFPRSNLTRRAWR